MPPIIILFLVILVFALRGLFSSGRRGNARGTGNTGAAGIPNFLTPSSGRPTPQPAARPAPLPVDWRATLPLRGGEGVDLGHGEGHPNRVLAPAFPDTLPKAQHMLPMEQAKAEAGAVRAATIPSPGMSPRGMIIADAILHRRGGRRRG